ncbi:MAG: MBL fold metallo-hydrolase [Lentisphaeria bacterium]|nr:MBL fold metallo-hydrolase [Lentisphaeria bacterium]
MKLISLPLGPFATNCFLVFIPESSELFIIDPGADAETIIAEAEKFPFKSARILLTHAHVDHISAAGKVAEKLHIPKVELAPEDHEMYLSKANALPPYFDAADDLPDVSGFDPIPRCTVIPLPGHTRGGSGFLFDDGREKFLISGDTIFCGSIGRTDLYGGDYAELINSITGKLLTLPDDLTVYPGHGGETTIGFEKKHNPYLN